MLTHVNSLIAEQTYQATRIADTRVNADQLRDAVLRKSEKFADKVNSLIRRTENLNTKVDDLKMAHADMVVAQNGMRQTQNVQGR